MSRFHTLTIAQIRRETAQSVSLSFAVPPDLKEAFSFQPGQYLTLRAHIDGHELRRSYSICSGLGTEPLRVGIKKVAGGIFSTYANDRLMAGDRLDVMAPQGRFILPPNSRARHILGIAAGSGITPILAIMKALLHQDQNSRFTLLYGNQTSQSVMFAEDIEDLKNRYLGRLSVLHLLSREAQDIPLLSGRITAERLLALAKGAIEVSTIDEAYLCGPQEMVSEINDALAALGVQRAHIHSETFLAGKARLDVKSAPVATNETVIAKVSATIDGKRQSFAMLASDGNIIDAAARVGIELPYSCKGGMCCTCRCKLEAGVVDMATNYSLEEWEIKAGFVLACQSMPRTAALSINFDQI